jgi:kumamolisin
MTADQYVTVPGSHRELPADAQQVGPGNAGQRLAITVQLRSRLAQGRNAAEPSQSREPTAHHLTREEFDALYGASPGDIPLIERFAADRGLDMAEVNSAARTVKLTGTRRQMEDAFRVELFDVRSNGTTFRGRSGSVNIPSELAPVIQGVFGLDDRPQARPHFRVSRCDHGMTERPGYSPRRVADLYGVPAGSSGRGQTIALIELGGGFSSAEVSSYFDALNLPRPRVTTVSVGGARNRPTGNPDGPDGAVLLDIEIVGAVAPQARIVVYFGMNTSAGFLDAVHAAVHDSVRQPSVLSIGWGSAEQNWTGQSLRAMDEAFLSAALLGVTVCVASGDDGSADAIADGRNHVDFPASSPHVLSCGGTRISAGRRRGLVAERGWGDPAVNGASGGGYSRVFDRPAWQQIGRPGTRRGVPDVAGNADPASGYSVLVDGSWRVAGGTSAAASLWAALIACASQRLGRPAGFVNPVLYTNPDVGIARDIVEGTNGAFTASQGWDPVTGLGSPRGAQLLSSPLALDGLVARLGTEAGRRELMSRLERLAHSGSGGAVVVSDPGDSSLCFVLNGGVEIVLRAGPRGPTRTHPVASVLPAVLAEQGMVDTVRWPGARMAYLDPELRGPTLPWRSAAGDGLMAYLARVFRTDHGFPAATRAGRRYVEPGVGRSYLVDFLEFTDSPEFRDFSVSGAGRTPYCMAGYLLPRAVTDGHMPSVRAWHRHQMAIRLHAAGVRVPRTAAIIDLPGCEHRMPDGTQLPAAMLIRGFRTILRVKQLDPLANLMMSMPWWRSVQDDVSGDAPSAGADRTSCSCYTPSVMLGTWPGRECTASSPCFQYRWQRVRADSPQVLAFARARLTVENGRDPATELMSAREFAVRFAATVGTQLSRLRELRVLHDYRVLREPDQDGSPAINSLCDTNVTLAGELADLDTVIAVDEPACEEGLLITRAERRDLAAVFDELHGIETGLASGICRTVALIACDGGRRAADDAAAAFWRAYERPSGERP